MEESSETDIGNTWKLSSGMDGKICLVIWNKKKMSHSISFTVHGSGRRTVSTCIPENMIGRAKFFLTLYCMADSQARQQWPGRRQWPGWQQWPGRQQWPGWQQWPGRQQWPGWQQWPSWQQRPGSDWKKYFHSFSVACTVLQEQFFLNL